MAVGQGFEPREGFPSTVFKTAAFDHSASPPKLLAGGAPAKSAHYIAALYPIKPNPPNQDPLGRCSPAALIAAAGQPEAPG